MIYLAGPINGCTDDEANSWRDLAKREFGAANCLDPMRRDYRGVELENVDEIVHGDLADIDMSSVVLANCWSPSYGTAMELWYAHTEYKPVVVMSPPDMPVSPWLAYVASKVTHDLTETFTAVKEFR